MVCDCVYDPGNGDKSLMKSISWVVLAQKYTFNFTRQEIKLANINSLDINVWH